MRDYQKYIEALRKCAKEHEYDRTPTTHILVSYLCRDTADLLEELEKEPTIGEMRTKIEKLKFEIRKGHLCGMDRVYGNNMILGINMVLKIFDEYETKSEE
jgi:hypothetical protein